MIERLADLIATALEWAIDHQLTATLLVLAAAVIAGGWVEGVPHR